MQLILIFVAVLALFTPGAVAGETVVVGTTSLPNLPNTMVAAPGATFYVEIPRCPTEINGQRVYLYQTDIYFDGVLMGGIVTVTNTSSQAMSWGVYGYGRSIVLSNGPLTGNPDQWTCEGSPIFSSCPWDALMPGETKTYYPGTISEHPSTDYVGSVERGWQGSGSRLLTATLVDSYFGDGLTGHWTASESATIGHIPGTNAVWARYHWTTTPPTERTRIVEGPWCQTPTIPESGDEVLTWLPVPSGHASQAWLEVDNVTQVDYGIEHLGQGSAVCGGQCYTGAFLWTAFDGTNCQLVTNIGTVNTSLSAFDGASDWRGSSGFLSLPNHPGGNGWGPRPVSDPSAYDVPGWYELRAASWYVDWNPQSVSLLAWGGDTTQVARVRMVKVR